MDIRDITSAIHDGRIRITDHAEEAAVDDHLAWDDIYYSVDSGEIIEDYPADKPYPSCLVLGQTQKGNRFIVYGLIIQPINGVLS